MNNTKNITGVLLEELEEDAKQYAECATPYCDADLEHDYTALDIEEAYKAGYRKALLDIKCLE